MRTLEVFIGLWRWQFHRSTLRSSAPLAQALASLLAGKFQAAIFTTGVQIDHFLEFARSQGQQEAAVNALSRIFIASIGPTCTESLQACGLKPALEPSHPKMGILVREAALRYAEDRK